MAISVSWFAKMRDYSYRNPENIEVINDILKLCKKTLDEDPSKGMELCSQTKTLLKSKLSKNINIKEVYKLLHKVLILESPYSLDSYLLALEWKRPIKERFWSPRRKILLPVIHDLEDLLIHDKLDEYFISMPPRVGKTTLILFIVSWVIGLNPELTNLYVSNSGTLCNAFYQGVYEILTDENTYCWGEIFPDAVFDKNTLANAKETYLDINRKKRYHSLTCRSIDAGLNGACDCNRLLVSDDLCSGIEEALSPERMNTLWNKVNNNMLPRAKESAKILWIGTRWSVKDPTGVRLEMLENDEKFSGLRYKVKSMPALDENDESNFDYDYGVGFSSAFYKRRRASFEINNDIASWDAQYQNAPYERHGQLFEPSCLTYYEDLPIDEKTGKPLEPDRIMASCDVAYNGSDFLSFPIGYQYGNILYIEDWIFDNRGKDKTEPRVFQKILEHKIGFAYFEANNGGEFYCDDIKRAVVEIGFKMNIQSKFAPTTISKQDRIYRHSSDIISNFRFKHPKKQNAEYAKAMRNLSSFTVIGKNKHEDAPDSLAMLVSMRQNLFSGATFVIFKRPF